MMIHRLFGTFGGLEKQELRLKEGLNILTAPNEWGKSTWTAFLLAMLYGVDTTERESKGVLPVKTKYKPWSGQDMAGVMELTFQGEEITLERCAKGRTPMGEFRAYHTQTGKDISYLTGDNCGLTLLGVERSVFERSGLIRQLGMAVTSDANLESRLTALVTTGQEDMSYSVIEKKLRDLRNRAQHNKTGVIPELEGELYALENTLEEVALLGGENMALQAREQELVQDEKSLHYALEAIKGEQQRKKQEQLARCQENFQNKQAVLEIATNTASGLPSQGYLAELMGKISLHTQKQSLLDLEIEPVAQRESAIYMPSIFHGLSGEQAWEKAQEDVRHMKQLEKPTLKQSPLLLVLGICAVVIALVWGGVCLGLSFMQSNILPLVLAIVLGILGVFSSFVYHKKRSQIAREEEKKKEEKSAYIRGYGVDTGEEILGMGADYRQALVLQEEAQSRYAQERQGWLEKNKSLHHEKNRLMEEIQTSFPTCGNFTQAMPMIENAISAHYGYQMAEGEAEQAKAALLAVSSMMTEGDMVKITHSPKLSSLTQEDVDKKLQYTQSAILEIHSRLHHQRGRMSALGDPALLAAKQEQLTDKLEAWRRQLRAVTLAMQALSRANQGLQTRFAPELNTLAGEYMKHLTNGKYNNVLMDGAMQVQTRGSEDIASHKAQHLSMGTGDQLYLAVRLGVADMLLRDNTPLILDDALLSFDDERMGLALELFAQRGQKQQIILFSCHSREETWMANCREIMK